MAAKSYKIIHDKFNKQDVENPEHVKLDVIQMPIESASLEHHESLRNPQSFTIECVSD